MPVAMNESTQQNALQQGLAVGCRALGITEITADWDSVKQSFRRAWLTWDQAHTMPAIRHDLVHSSIRPALVRSKTRPGSLIASWSCEGALRPLVREDIAPGALPDLLALVTAISLEDWIELTRSLVAGLDDHDVVHEDYSRQATSGTPEPAI
ncbi:hypothetical protein [Sanguibacter sp. Leaf3]|uniref:hypothetical protein n=1 Tax=Sanguibacter sp. Leaf3 TaxID=1736209 RepID=UPI0006FE6E22|nr:hypothetical protein [Sanguibacter sp. Leaf3]KQT97718.1 hypothetical protein ASG53_07960 [Sanguibacter sp. Leaf3]